MRKAYKTPFVLMLFAAVLVMLYNYVVFKVVLREHMGRFPFYIRVMFWGWPLVLLGEAIIYWVVRRRIYDRRSASAHLWLVYLGFLVIPVLILRFIQTRWGMAFGPSGIQYILYTRIFLFWAPFVIGHIYFAKVLTRKPELPPVEPSEGPNILDDVLD